MKLAILGYGKEGKSVESYFKNHQVPSSNIKIFDNFTPADLEQLDFSSYDLIFRSPSVPPLQKTWTSITKYFFKHCPCPIIGVTGTKGKGTTSSIIAQLLQALNKTVHLVGNIGLPALDALDNIRPSDIVVYELSSFQLWDLDTSPNISVILHIEPDHLNIHKDFDDYLTAKANIAKFQTPADSCIFCQNNNFSTKIASLSPAQKFPYPSPQKPKKLTDLLNSLSIPGKHNQENAEAALLAVSASENLSLDDFINKNFDALKTTFKNFKGLPHRLEFVREINGIKFYDDNFSTTFSSLEVAVHSFPDNNIILILGGRDKTNGSILPQLTDFVNHTKNIKQAILIGESGRALFEKFPSKKFTLSSSLPVAVKTAYGSAKLHPDSIVLMSPASASFDMFENVYDRGTQYQTLINSL